MWLVSGHRRRRREVARACACACACACVEIAGVFLRPTTSRCRCESVVVRRRWRFREVITRSSVASSKSRE